MRNKKKDMIFIGTGAMLLALAAMMPKCSAPKDLVHNSSVEFIDALHEELSTEEPEQMQCIRSSS